MGIFITNYAFKSRVFYWCNHLYTPCRTGNTTFYKLVVKAMQILLDGQRVFAVKLTNSLAIILSRNTQRIVGIFITDCDFKSRVFCWFNLLSQQFRDGDISGERKTNQECHLCPSSCFRYIMQIQGVTCDCYFASASA